MKLSDEQLTEFLWKSSLKSFPAILDALRYLDGKWVQEEAEYDVFDEAMGDNPPEWDQNKGSTDTRDSSQRTSSFCSSRAGFRFD